MQKRTFIVGKELVYEVTDNVACEFCAGFWRDGRCGREEERIQCQSRLEKRPKPKRRIQPGKEESKKEAPKKDEAKKNADKKENKGRSESAKQPGPNASEKARERASEKSAEAKKYRIDIIPTQIFYDASGKELFRHEGFFSKDDILAKWKEMGVMFPG